jgi:nonsense-mediated mRNA decay protein 3
MELICPKCGASSRETDFSGPFCIKCRPVEIKCPKRLEFMRCSRCGRVRLKGNWVACPDEKLAQEALSKCKGEYLKATYSFMNQEGTFFVGDKEHMFPVKKKFKVNVVKNICPDCVRKSGGYFEAVIQLRGKTGKIRKYERLFKKMLAKKTFVTKEEELKEGLDLYIGNSRAVVEMLAELGVRARISRKLAGEKAGKRLYRTTFLVRV